MIPLQFHFISFQAPENVGGRPFSYVNYLCLYSAIKAHPGAVFNFYYNQEIEGEWFERIKSHLTLHQIEPPTEIFGLPVKRVEHQADLVRLRVLQEKGGIYLDTDIFVCRPFLPLLKYPFVMGEECNQGLCNGVILSEPDSPFVREWLAAYDPRSPREGAGFKPDGWAEMSVRFPDLLSREFPGYITILSMYAFHEPMGSPRGMNFLFHDPEYENPEAFAQHLWASQAWELYLKNMRPETIMEGEGYFYRLVRRTLEEAEIFGLMNLHA
ncbi:MAG: hypothetical protein H6581_12035 [Bacteroidia bacterium]|nr:hypothetical protein [Bacteroidia bacterium]